jgi:hypothetical protein
MTTYYRHPVGRPYEVLCDYCADPEWSEYGPVETSLVEPDYDYYCTDCERNSLIDGQCHEEFHFPDADGVCLQCEGGN